MRYQTHSAKYERVKATECCVGTLPPSMGKHFPVLSQTGMSAGTSQVPRMEWRYSCIKVRFPICPAVAS